MKGHPKAGEPTDFKDKLLSGEKIHTIRGNYLLWQKRIREVQSGNAVVSIRQWEGKPYRSNQVEIARIDHSSGCGVQLISMGKPNKDEIYWNVDSMRTKERLDEVAKNDGLSCEDFCRWFFPDRIKKSHFIGAIIHFTPFRYE